MRRGWRIAGVGLIGVAAIGGGEAGAQPAIEPSAAYRNSWALVIGINDYHRVPRLNYAVADAKAIKEALPALGFPQNKTQLLLDREATKARIEWVLYNDFRHMGSEDRLLVYFAGHGETSPLKHGQEEGYILPVDADAEALPATAIAMADLRKIGQRLRGKHFLFIMDACFSGFALTRSGPDKPTGDPYLQSALKGQAVQVLTAGRKGEKAIEQGGHGLFTRRLLEGLRGAADTDNQGFVTAAQLFNWIQPLVTRESKGSMNPQFSNLDGEGQFVLFLPKRAAAPKHRPPSLPPDLKEVSAQPPAVTAPAAPGPDPALEAERRRVEQERKRLEQERALLEEQKRLEKERRALEEERRRMPAPAPPEKRVAAIQPPAEKVPVQIVAVGHALLGFVHAIVSLGVLTPEYAVEIDGTLAVEWRTLNAESQVSLAAGAHKLRVLRRYFAVRTPVVLYEGSLTLEGGKNQVAIDFAAQTVTINGKVAFFMPEK
jgi:uncharacterized caspase-like protein